MQIRIRLCLYRRYSLDPGEPGLKLSDAGERSLFVGSTLIHRLKRHFLTTCDKLHPLLNVRETSILCVGITSQSRISTNKQKEHLLTYGIIVTSGRR